MLNMFLLYQVQTNLNYYFKSGGKRKSGERLKYIETFHPIKYQELSSNDKREHSLINCKSCAKYFSNVQATFEIYLNPTKHSKNMDGETSSSFKTETLKENTQQIYNLVNKPFEKKYGISFAESITNLKELNIEKKSTKYEKKKEKRRIIREVKENIEKDWESDAVERFVYTYIKYQWRHP